MSALISEEEPQASYLVGDPAVVLENVVVGDTLSKCDLLGDGENVGQVLVWKLMKLLGVVCVEMSVRLSYEL